MNPLARPLAASAAVVTAALLAGCGSSGAPTAAKPSATAAKDGAIAVDAGDSSCAVATTKLAAGRHTFAVANHASQVMEVYVYMPGDRIVGEVENIGPATTRELTVDLTAGQYQVACKPGMVGDGIRSPLRVSGAAPPPQSLDQNLRDAVDSYRRYVRSETRALAETTTAFTDAIAAGDLARARRAYPPARLHYERIEPIAESFGDLDPLIDMRADDAVGGTTFVGFHALERLLFAKRTLAGAKPLATALDANVAKLNTLVADVKITPLTMSNGAKSLLDEVAKSKVTGEEERYSRIDLLDFAGNVDGAEYVYRALRPALQTRDAQLVGTLDRRFPALVKLLDTHRAAAGAKGSVPGSPFVAYSALAPDEIKALAVEVDAISEPLGKLGGVVAGG